MLSGEKRYAPEGVYVGKNFSSDEPQAKLPFIKEHGILVKGLEGNKAHHYRFVADPRISDVSVLSPENPVFPLASPEEERQLLPPQVKAVLKGVKDVMNGRLGINVRFSNIDEPESSLSNEKEKGLNYKIVFLKDVDLAKQMEAYYRKTDYIAGRLPSGLQEMLFSPKIQYVEGIREGDQRVILLSQEALLVPLSTKAKKMDQVILQKFTSVELARVIFREMARIAPEVADTVVEDSYINAVTDPENGDIVARMQTLDASTKGNDIGSFSAYFKRKAQELQQLVKTGPVRAQRDGLGINIALQSEKGAQQVCTLNENLNNAAVNYFGVLALDQFLTLAENPQSEMAKHFRTFEEIDPYLKSKNWMTKDMVIGRKINAANRHFHESFGSMKKLADVADEFFRGLELPHGFSFAQLPSDDALKAEFAYYQQSALPIFLYNKNKLTRYLASSDPSALGIPEDWEQFTKKEHKTDQEFGTFAS